MAINLVPAGQCTTLAGATVTTDQRGIIRPQSVSCHTGAFEAVEAPQAGEDFTVNTLNNVKDGLCSTLHCSLRDAIVAANATNTASTIDFSVSGTISLAAEDSTLVGLPYINTPITMDGDGSITIERREGPIPPFSIFYIAPSASLTLNGLTVRNGVNGGAGAIFNDGGELNINSSTLTANISTGSNGGAVYNTGTLNIFNSTLSGNMTVGNGGAIYNQNGDVTLDFVTITRNIADSNSAGGDSGGGVFNIGGTVTVRNSIIAGNTQGSGNGSADDCRNPASGYSWSGSNLVGSDGDDGNCGEDANRTVVAGPISDVLDTTLQVNDSGTPTHALFLGSPAINFADDCTTISENPVTEDQRGISRPQGGLCDVGAFEFEDQDQIGDILTVNTTDDTDDTVCTILHCSLREAINAANADGVDSGIHFDIPGSAPYVITVESDLPSITAPVAINGMSSDGNPDGICLILQSEPLLVQIDGGSTQSAGLVLAAGSDDSTIHGLSITNFVDYGIQIQSGDNTVTCNYIGASADGLTAGGNGVGIALETDSSANTIGSNEGSDGNVIVNSAESGIQVESSSNSILSNVIFDNNQSEDPDSGGIVVLSGVSNRIQDNALYDNTGLGIDLAPSGVDTNDLEDADSRANTGQNYPLIVAATESNILGTLHSTPSTEFFIDVYVSEACDPSGHGEGETYVDTTSVFTDSDGNAVWSIDYEGYDGAVVTALAINENTGDTSEFSPCATAGAAPTTFVVNSTHDANDNNVEDGLCYTGNMNSEGQPECTLYSAIEQANATEADEEILFNIPGDGPHTIDVGDELPDITDTVSINGLSELITGDTCPLPTGALGIQLNDTGEVDDGLDLDTGSDDSSIRGLSITGFEDDGIQITSHNNTITCNYLGIAADGVTAGGNGFGLSVLVGAAGNNIGGLAEGSGNVIANNPATGVALINVSSNGVQGNLIHHNGDGVSLSSADNSTISDNTIHSNTYDGVSLSQGMGNTIKQNEIYNNTELGIDLAVDEVTENDAGDADTGDNHLQNFPVITSAASNESSFTQVEGELDSIAGTYTIEFFDAGTCDASGYGEGEVYLGSETVLVETTGSPQPFSANVPAGSTVGGSLTATVTNQSTGDTSEFSLCADITEANEPPIVDAGEDTTADEGSTFNLSATYTDPDADGDETYIATIDWGDGSMSEPASITAPTESGPGTVTASHVYADDGTYTITVTVNDGADDGTDTVDVMVSNVDPTLTVVGNQTASEGVALSITNIGTFTDPGFDNPDNPNGASVETFTYEINWGDGSINDTSSADVDTPGSAGTPTAGSFDGSHVYADNGMYLVSVTVTDDDGGTDTGMFSVTVSNVVPELSNVSVTTSDEGSAATLTGTINDPGTEDTFTLVVDWGDGSAAETFNYAAGTTSFSETHTYVDDNPTATASDSYTVSLTISDDDSGQDTETTTATVNNVTPALSGVSVTTSSEGSTATLNGTVIDPGTTDTFTLVVDWGDGSTSQTFNYAAGTTSFSETHVYADDNPTATASDSYTVNLTFTDDDLGSDSTNTSIKVNNVSPTLTVVGSQNAVEDIPFTITNIGTFTDPGFGPLEIFTYSINWGDGSTDSTGAATIDTPEGAGSPTAGSFDGTHTYADDGVFTVTVTVTDDDGGSDTETFTITVTEVQPPSITVSKTNNANNAGIFSDDETGAQGFNVPYRVVISNLGVSAVTITNITDDVHPSIGTCAALINTTINGGSSVQCDFSAPLPLDDDATVIDTITVSVSNAAGTDTESDSTTARTADTLPVISVAKLNNANGDGTFSDDETAAPGTTVTYRVTITNTGQDAVTINSISDTPYPINGPSCPALIGSTLNPTQSATCTFTAALPNSYDQTVVDMVTVTVSDDDGNNTSASDTTTARTTATVLVEYVPCDDAYNRSTTFSNTAQQLNFSNDWYSGVRFCGIPLPQGVTITSAQLRVVAASGAASSANVQIAFENVNDSAPFANTTSGRPSGRTLTSSLITWNLGTWSLNSTYLSPNIVSSLQTVLSRPGWIPGNDLSVIVRPLGTGALHQAWSLDVSDAKSVRAC